MPSGGIHPAMSKWQAFNIPSNFISKGDFMPSNNSPLESLAAFAIVFVAGVLSILGFSTYIEKIKRDVRRANPPD
jgi:hypothetical protein